MFDDHVVTWGRIVTFYAFCGYLARHCLERDLHDCPGAIAETLSSIVVNRLGLWIVANGGWVVICSISQSNARSPEKVLLWPIHTLHMEDCIFFVFPSPVAIHRFIGFSVRMYK